MASLALYLTYFNSNLKHNNIDHILALAEQQHEIEDNQTHTHTHSSQTTKTFSPSLQTPIAALQTGSLSHHNNEFVTIRFKQNYKRKTKKKKEKNLKDTIEIKIQQHNYKEVGAAWKVWDSATILGRWIFLNNHLLAGKTVLEVGSGCGLVGILASFYAKQITISDYLPDILEGIEKNVSLNYSSLSMNHEHIQIRKIDFQDFVGDEKNEEVREYVEKFDVVLGSDVVYSLQLAHWLPFLLNSVLKCNGFFYAVMPKNRLGLDEFVENMASLGFNLQILNPPEQLFEDFAKKSHWFLYVFQKLNQNHSKADLPLGDPTLSDDEDVEVV